LGIRLESRLQAVSAPDRLKAGLQTLRHAPASIVVGFGTAWEVLPWRGICCSSVESATFRGINYVEAEDRRIGGAAVALDANACHGGKDRRLLCLVGRSMDSLFRLGAASLGA
jgi:hypothetical protein